MPSDATSKGKVRSEAPCLFQARARPETKGNPHTADQHVGRQIATVRVHSDVSQAQLARSIGISFQQLHKYENASLACPPRILHRIPAIPEHIPTTVCTGGSHGKL
ncbi:helix-turn-helix transcriptional regulator [Mesorhizobium sp.]|uniref:helix-turn-helix domain-containing protein n=1 Tax=Mesorhizobium sp. TaxID=1871066 RepID=UPI00341F2CAF